MKLLALIAALLTCLPGGWCCAAGEGGASAEPAKGETGGCPRCAGDEAGHEGPTAPSEGSCCCELHPVVLTPSVERAAADALPAVSELAVELPPILAAATFDEVALPGDSPPLYVLKCVWRC